MSIYEEVRTYTRQVDEALDRGDMETCVVMLDQAMAVADARSHWWNPLTWIDGTLAYREITRAAANLLAYANAYTHALLASPRWL